MSTLVWAATVVGILLVGGGALVLLDWCEERRLRRIHRQLEMYGRKRVGL